MGKEFGVGAGAQFVQVEPLALAFGGDALRKLAVEQRVQAIRQRQNETE